MRTMRGKRNDRESEKEMMKLALDFRMSGVETLRLLCMFSTAIMLMAWSSFLLQSLLYLISFLGTLTALVYGMEASKRDETLGPFASIAIFASIFFFTFSLSGSGTMYLLGSYLSAATSPIALHQAIRARMMKSPGLEEVLGFE